MLVFINIDLNSYDGNTARETLNQVLNSNNITSKKFNIVKDYIDQAGFIFKSGFEKLASDGNFDFFLNGFYLNQMIISCTFQGVSCEAADFYYYHDYNYGSCFSFNLGKVNNASPKYLTEKRDILKSEKSGWENGLQLELFVGSETSQQQYAYKSGVRVIVHNQSITPFPNIDGIDVATGQQTNIMISRSFIKHLSEPYSQCINPNKNEIDWNKNDIFKFMKNYYDEKFESYSQKFCLKVCLQKYLIENCNCFDPQYPMNTTNITSCYKVTQINCINDLSAIFYETSKANECYSKCSVSYFEIFLSNFYNKNNIHFIFESIKIECEYSFYDIETTIANYPTEWYSGLLVCKF